MTNQELYDQFQQYEHPKTYELTRDEWKALNRALCGAKLEMSGIKYAPAPNTDRGQSRNERLIRTDIALDIISTVYKRAEEKMNENN